MFRRLADFTLKFRQWLLPVMITGGLLCGLALFYLDFDFSPKQFFGTRPELAEFREEFSEVFGREDNLTVVSISGDDIFDPAVLSTIRNVTLEARQLDSVVRAESIATFQIPRSGGPGTLATDPILDQTLKQQSDGTATPVDPSQADELKDVAMQEPLVKNRLIDAQGDAAAILVWLDRDLHQVSKMKPVVQSISDMLDAHPLPDGYDYRVGGIPSLRVDIVDGLRNEQITFLPLTGVVFLILLFYLFRRPAGVIVPVAVVVMAVFVTIALMVFTGYSMNVVNNVLPIVIFVIGIADSIHMVTRHAEEVQQGASHREAIRRMVEETGFACLMTSTTTAVGFISLLAASTDMLRNFGWQAAMGVMVAYLFTILFLPAAISYLKPVDRVPTSPERNDNSDDSGSGYLESWLMTLADRLLDRPVTVVACSLAIGAGFAYAASFVVIDTKLLTIYEKGHPTYETTKSLEQKFGGFLPLEISLKSTEKDRFKDPAMFKKIDELQSFAAERSPVLSTQSLVDFHQSARAALLGTPDAREQLPENRAQVEQLQVLIEGSPDDPTGVYQFVTRDFAHARVLLRVGDVGARRTMALAETLKEKLRELFGPADNIEYRITGDAYVASVTLDVFIRDLFYSLFFAAIIIFFLMAGLFRSIRIGLISMIPNTLPLVCTFGYMGMQGINLNSTTVIIFAIGLGLAVDDTIHVLARFREEIGRHDSPRQAIRQTYFGAGRAIVLTSVLLLLGLSVLQFSSFVPTVQFATLTSVTILGAILGDLLLLPPLLLLLHRYDPTIFGQQD
jgi:hydrophobe/amphiphile efflux-3 (HAE3) family protein